MWGVEIVVMLGMIGINSIFAAYELALASITLARLQLLVTEGRRGAVASLHMKQNLEGSLAGIQLGITLVGAIGAATGGAGAEERLSPWIQSFLGVSGSIGNFLAIAAVVAPFTVFTIIFGELIPKVFALRNKEWVCLKLSPLMKLFVTVVWPVVWCLEQVVRGVMSWGERRFRNADSRPTPSEAQELQELRAIVALARTSRLIGDQEEKIILAAAALTARPISDIMLEASAISVLVADDDIGQALVAAHLDMHTRFPVTEEKDNPQKIIGYVNFKDIISHMRISPHGTTLRKLLRTIPRFSAGRLVSDCLGQLIREHSHIALVEDSRQVIVGMITLEDIMEELVGDIEDEFDHLPTHVSRSGRGWIIGGGVSPARVEELTALALPDPVGEPTAHTLNEWIVKRLGRTLRGGETILQNNRRIIVRKIRRGKVLEAHIEGPLGP